jgi:hypothetical protein
MRALILRRVALIENCAGGPVLVGPGQDRANDFRRDISGEIRECSNFSVLSDSYPMLSDSFPIK